MKEFRLVQHNLIPLALVFANISLAHLIYAFSQAETAMGLLVSACFIALMAGSLRKNKYLLIAGTACYLIILVWRLTLL